MNIHEQAEAFALLDDAIDALFAITHDDAGDHDAVLVDAVLIVGAQAVDNAGARTAHVNIYPRAGAQPADVRGLIREAGQLLDAATNHPTRASRPRPAPPAPLAG
ncbi:DUF7213 family protein [Mycobacterium marinum]|uniref:DUF7213 family protein n=1 Tax=Mycobacterium marinum TaxID=1781 RepID=UPI00192236FC|nr:hypothetical protein [Mycobacterium marinum]QQW36886.1 hypothetical protein HXW97_25965 [Mycobacterium marinum]